MKVAKNEHQMHNSERIAVLETTIFNINAILLDVRQDIKRSFDKIDNKLDTLENKMDSKFDALENKMDSKFATVDTKFDALQNRLWSNFLWLMGMIIGLAGLIAHTQHWI